MTTFLSIGSILMSITTILMSIVTILGSIEQVNTPYGKNIPFPYTLFVSFPTSLLLGPWRNIIHLKNP